MLFNLTKEKIIFFNVPVILFCLLPLFLITGPFLSDLSVSLISILYLIYCIKKKNFSEFKNIFFYFFLIFWGYLIFNSLVVNLNFDSFKISFFFFRYGVFVIAVTALLNFDASFMKYFFYCIFVCFLILIIDGYVQYFDVEGENIFGFTSGSYGRVSSFFGKELILGSYLTRLWPLFFGLSILFLKKKNFQFVIFIMIFILSESLIFLSGERVAFFYINLSAIFIVFFSNKLSKLRLITLTMSILIIIGISFFVPTAKERIIDRTLNQMNLNIFSETDNNEIIIFSDEHNQHYISALKIFNDNKVLGVGVKNFRKYCGMEKYKSEKSCSTHPHNTYLQILTEIGIIGFIFIILIFLYYCYLIFKHSFLKIKGKNYFNDFEICMLSGILLFIWPFAPTGNVFNNWLSITLILNIPFLIWSRSLKKNKI